MVVDVERKVELIATTSGVREQWRGKRMRQVRSSKSGDYNAL
jgi:hypothetical protein